MLALLLPPLKDEVPDWSKPVFIANCLGLSSTAYWNRRLDKLRERLKHNSLIPESGTTNESVNWEYSTSVSPRLTLSSYLLDAPLLTIWVDGRSPITEGKHTAEALARCIPPAELQTDFCSLADDYRFLMRTRCKEELRELALKLNEANPQEIVPLLMSPNIVPIRLLKAKFLSDALTNAEQACIDRKRNICSPFGSTSSRTNVLEDIVQEIDLCRRGWLRKADQMRRKNQLTNKRDDELSKLLLPQSFAFRLGQQKECFRICSPLPPLLQCLGLLEASTHSPNDGLERPSLFVERNKFTSTRTMETLPTISVRQNANLSPNECPET
eukprot:Gregarina_sp_Poly_1__1477@NODE_136_length_13140_cov_67_629236_g121_i0_p4_GENE_NODE_136_length_13140_cov_67_629236_g121_i0NODE_136_length_13140_cov_67_629236_g121_i0_p4_ORF_typecomplete_len327_score40_62_NODE_136_length_13140_cov_67_629236_g121_i070067986